MGLFRTKRCFDCNRKLERDDPKYGPVCPDCSRRWDQEKDRKRQGQELLEKKLSSSDRPSCLMCAFSEKCGDGSLLECCRFPPQVVGNRYGEAGETGFPRVKVNWWCGEFTRRDDSQEELRE